MNEHEANKRVAAVALEEMFKKGTFYISDLWKCAELMGVPRRGGVWARLDALSGIKILDMPEDIQAQLPAWINEALSGPRISAVMVPALREGNVHTLGLEDKSS